MALRGFPHSIKCIYHLGTLSEVPVVIYLETRKNIGFIIKICVQGIIDSANNVYHIHIIYIHTYTDTHTNTVQSAKD